MEESHVPFGTWDVRYVDQYSSDIVGSCPQHTIRIRSGRGIMCHPN